MPAEPQAKRTRADLGREEQQVEDVTNETNMDNSTTDTAQQQTPTEDNNTLKRAFDRISKLETKTTKHDKQIERLEVRDKAFNLRIDGIPERTAEKEDRAYWTGQLRAICVMMGMGNDMLEGIFDQEGIRDIYRIVRIPAKTVHVTFTKTSFVQTIMGLKRNLGSQKLPNSLKTISVNLDKTDNRRELEKKARDKRIVMMNDPLYANCEIKTKGANVEVKKDGKPEIKFFDKWALTGGWTRIGASTSNT